MQVTEREFDVAAQSEYGSLITYFGDSVREFLNGGGRHAVRFVVTSSNAAGFRCEVGVMKGPARYVPDGAIFEFVPRSGENADQFNAVMIVPTGIGAEIGGHAGDATPAARLLASACDTLITHPNVVNASDINELPENGLYVEGSVLARLLMGTVALQRVRSNRVLLAIDKHEDPRISDLAINAASAARATLGLDCAVRMLDRPLRIRGTYSSSGRAVGRVENLEHICGVLADHRAEFDAVAIASVIEVPHSAHLEYYQLAGEMVNPWGGAEAMLTHSISMLFDVPSAHAPMIESMEISALEVGVVDPRMAAEAVSTCYLHCVLKGLHRSPQLVTDPTFWGHADTISAADVSCLVIPDGCVGLPTLAALEQGIPVIAVRENSNQMRNDLRALPFAPGQLFVVENYLEAVGVMTALKAGVSVSAVRRPLAATKVSS